jgi:DNA-binding NarL/FixJ family response regulator
MRALVIADSGPALARLTAAAVELHNVALGHANGRTHVGELVRGFGPDLVLIDDMGWPPRVLARLEEIRGAAPGAAVIVFAERLEDAWLADALRGGATAVLPAAADHETVRRVVDEVFNRERVAA